MLVDRQGNDHGLLVDDMKVVIVRNEWFVPDALITSIPPEAHALAEMAVEATEDQVTRFKEAIDNFHAAKSAMIDIAAEIDSKA